MVLSSEGGILSTGCQRRWWYGSALAFFKHDCEHLEVNVWMGSSISVSVAVSGICHAVFAADVHLYIIIMACSLWSAVMSGIPATVRYIRDRFYF